jgi:putative Holliday junction resolvase
VRTGVRLAVDVGSVRVGVARSDGTGSLAVPVATLKRDQGDVMAIVDLVAEYEVLEIVVGYPLTLSNERGPAAEHALAYARKLSLAVSPTPVVLVDERLTTAAAQRGLHEAGRNTKNSRAVIDQAAAVQLLQDALDAERASGTRAGTLIEDVAQ